VQQTPALRARGDPGYSARAKARLQNEMQEAQARGFVALAVEARLALVRTLSGDWNLLHA